jgi:hypothetical protein
MPRVGFQPTIPLLERAKTVHALDRALTMIGWDLLLPNGTYSHLNLYVNMHVNVYFINLQLHKLQQLLLYSSRASFL